jgi:NFACT protein RNA binding domain
MNEDDAWDAIPKDLLTDCVQLTKANSIEGKLQHLSTLTFRNNNRRISLQYPPQRIGNKKDNVHVVYTPWSNLKKDGSMAVGQVGFKDPKKVKKVLVEKRENPIVNRLNKTKTEKFPDLRQEKETRLKELRERDRAAQQERVRPPSQPIPSKTHLSKP